MPSCRHLCRLSPEAMEGPYYVPKQQNRTNITDNYPGVPLVLTLIIKNYNTCQPMENVTVDIWHSNGEGVYSGKGMIYNKLILTCYFIEILNLLLNISSQVTDGTKHSVAEYK